MTDNQQTKHDQLLTPENVQEYPRPPALERVPQRIRIWLGGEMIADTDLAWRVLETHHAPTYYLPPDTVSGKLVAAGGGSICEWKGRAQYFDVFAGGVEASRAAWCYPNPSESFIPIAGYLAFYAGQMDRCLVGGVEATAQAGGFYGGWVTPNLTGTIKGAPGTEYW